MHTNRLRLSLKHGRAVSDQAWELSSAGRTRLPSRDFLTQDKTFNIFSIIKNTPEKLQLTQCALLGHFTVQS